jgi:hypothetical protein
MPRKLLTDGATKITALAPLFAKSIATCFPIPDNVPMNRTTQPLNFFIGTER